MSYYNDKLLFCNLQWCRLNISQCDVIQPHHDIMFDNSRLISEKIIRINIMANPTNKRLLSGKHAKSITTNKSYLSKDISKSGKYKGGGRWTVGAELYISYKDYVFGFLCFLVDSSLCYFFFFLTLIYIYIADE